MDTVRVPSTDDKIRMARDLFPQLNFAVVTYLLDDIDKKALQDLRIDEIGGHEFEHIIQGTERVRRNIRQLALEAGLESDPIAPTV